MLNRQFKKWKEKKRLKKKKEIKHQKNQHRGNICGRKKGKDK
jgi:hypothetical protein